MPVTIKSSKFKYRTSDGEQYISVDGIADNKTSEQVARVTAEGTSQVNRLQIQGDSIIDQIYGVIGNRIGTYVTDYLDAHPIQGYVYDDTEIRGMISEINNRITDLHYVPISISNFSVNPTKVEKGNTNVSVTITYTLNKVPTTLTLDEQSITSTQSGSTTVTGLSENKTWTLVATDTGSQSHQPTTATKTTTLSFVSKAYWGAAEIPSGGITNAFLLGLSNNELTATKARSITVTAGSNNYIWYAIPSSFGECSFTFNGNTGGFVKQANAFSHTNASGYTENYDIYRSKNTNLGNTKVTVS